MARYAKINKGFTLVELLVGLVVGLIVLSAVLYSFLTTARSSVYLRQTSELISETDALTSVMTGEFRRVGYSDSNIATSLDTSVTHCVLYRYDKPDASEGDVFGFRLKSGAVQTIASSTASCSVSDWENITPPNVSVASLSISSSPSDSAEVRSVQIYLSTEHVQDSDISVDLTKTVLLRNDVSQD